MQSELDVNADMLSSITVIGLHEVHRAATKPHRRVGGITTVSRSEPKCGNLTIFLPRLFADHVFRVVNSTRSILQADVCLQRYTAVT